ncbi:hypothetical protein QR680_014937 [Steinernema hermaphroditum]|uniref:HAT C-terminal dimerisation domain-containing protein n=1 Tax=Steinernema hermaphroditum TaxID=289476 RepID=A0AA39ICR7_9BILA|nr:hypothetical protein QR680_014937 [Steinernema hermaphroditum]
MELGENRTNKMQVQEAEQLSKRAAQTCITDYAEDWHKQRSQKFETLLVKFIADANLSANIVEYQSFKALVRFNAGNVKMPSRHEILGPVLDREYQKAKDRTQSIFSGKPLTREGSQVPDADRVEICVTADSYTKGTHSLFAITTHLLTSDFRSVSEIIAIVPCAEMKHTAVNLSSLVAENLKSLEISLSDVVRITCDGAANMSAMCDTLGVASIHCFCHNVHLIVKSALERCVRADELVKKATDIVASFRRSNCQTAALADIENVIDKEVHGPDSNFTPTLLKTACPTRWNSVTECVESVVEKEEALLRYAKSASNRRSVQASSISQLSPVDFEDLRHIMNTLKPLEHATNLASGSEAHVGILPFLVKQLTKNYENLKTTSRSDEVSSLAFFLSEECKRRFNQYKSNENIELAYFLDPRFHRKRFLPVSTWNEIEALVRRRLLGQLASKSTHAVGECDAVVENTEKSSPTMERRFTAEEALHLMTEKDDDEASDMEGEESEPAATSAFDWLTNTDEQKNHSRLAPVQSQEERKADDEINRFKEVAMEELPMPNDYGNRRCLQWLQVLNQKEPFRRLVYYLQTSCGHVCQRKKTEKLLVVKAAARNETSTPDPEDDYSDAEE